MKTLLCLLALSFPLASLAQDKPAAPPPAAKPAAAPAAAPAAKPGAPTAAPAAAPAAAAPALTPEQEKIAAYVKKIQAERAEAVAKGLPLTASEAVKFWTVYEKYEAGFADLVSQQTELTQKYVANEESLDDAGLLALVNGLLDRDAKAAAYRAKWVPEFQKVLPMKVVARFFQLERRLALQTQLDIADRVRKVD